MAFTRVSPIKRKTGFMVPAALIIASVLGITIAAASKTFLFSSRARSYFDVMDRTYEGARYGRNKVIGELVYQSDPSGIDASEQETPDGVRFRNQVMIRSSPVDPTFYIVTTARRQVGLDWFTLRLHSYVRVSNVAEYFAAVADELSVSAGADLDGAKIFAPKLDFQLGGGPPTVLREAKYSESVTPAVWDGAVKAAVQITHSPNNEPQQIASNLVFPQIDFGDMMNYRRLADVHTVTSEFSGDIFPPGYEGGALIGDTYPHHTEDNRHHIYFFDGDMRVEGRVHGQVLFVATGDIYLSSSVFVADNGYALPGAGFASSSTAHQAIFITTNNVIIEDMLPANGTLTIQALVIAPNGGLIPKPYADALVPPTLSLDFTGSLIVSTLRSDPTLPVIFQASRRYRYMNSLREQPPPFLPAIVEIYSSTEEVTNPAGLF